jgi:hypothetical protein
MKGGDAYVCRIPSGERLRTGSFLSDNVKMKNYMYSVISAVALFALACSASAVWAFKVPEKLTYDLTWTGIKAGTATLEIIQNSATMQIVSTAKSADWISFFYTVNDRVESVLRSPQPPSLIGQPQSYRMKIREGRHRRDREVVFDLGGRSALYIDHLRGEKKSIPLHDTVFDPLSSFYYVRTMKLEVGRSVFVDILDNKKLWNVEVLVLGKEKIRTKLGSFDTIVIKPLMKSEGIFNRKGDILIWLTDDERRLPVMMRTKVVVGSVTATLVGGQY